MCSVDFIYMTRYQLERTVIVVVVVLGGGSFVILLFGDSHCNLILHLIIA